MNLDITRRIERVAKRSLRDIREDDRLREAGLSPNGKHKRYGGNYLEVDASGQSHVRGHAFKSYRSDHGVTKDDVAAFRRGLKAEGVILSFDAAESTLLEIQTILEGPITPKHQRWRERTARRREIARESGICIVCMKNPTDSGRTTCYECQRKATARKKERSQA